MESLVNRYHPPEGVYDEMFDGSELRPPYRRLRSSLDAMTTPDLVSRVEAHGTHVQVQQFRWALCVVIKPDPALVHGLAPEAIGPAVFRAVFSKGDQMAVADAIAVPGAPAGTTVYRGAAVPGRLWWQWQLWCTDGSAVGLYMVKYDGGQLTVGADDPWF